MGFGVPVGDWIKGPLLDWAESLLDQDVLNKQGFFNSQQVRDVWQNHKCGRQDKSGHLWTILMFQAWLMQRAIR
jgi:asparagine synthase (glutamine-hydrolysing)